MTSESWSIYHGRKGCFMAKVLRIAKDRKIEEVDETLGDLTWQWR